MTFNEPRSAEPDSVLSINEFSRLAGVSIATARRMIAADDAPIVTRLSQRRIGIRMRHLREWLDARTENPQRAA
jgi:predicted DNA-binding transcriptional regulator AlpA